MCCPTVSGIAALAALLTVLASLPDGWGRDQSGPNRLSEEEARAGWSLLFDGSTLNGWRGYKRPDAAGTRWRIEDGLLTVPAADGKDTRGALDLITTATYDQFELAFEWKVAEGANSGVKYFVLEDREAAIGHEYQIIDDERHPDARVGPNRQTAAFYDVLPAANRSLRPAGEFNQGRILVQGHQVEHWLNGTRVLRYELNSRELQAAIDRSKFKGIVRFGRLQPGHILLQDHGDRVWYRNVKIRKTASGSQLQPLLARVTRLRSEFHLVAGDVHQQTWREVRKFGLT